MKWPWKAEKGPLNVKTEGIIKGATNWSCQGVKRLLVSVGGCVVSSTGLKWVFKTELGVFWIRGR